MASTVATGLFNAIAFAGAGFRFSKMNKNGYEEEMSRHDKAMEKLAKAKEDWYESQVEKKNKLDRLRQETLDADKDFEITNKALHDYRTAREEMDTEKIPTINDFYKPSSDMESYINTTKGLLGLGCGYAISRVIL